MAVGAGMIYFVVKGIPIGQGSMKAFPRKGGRGVIVTHNSSKLKPWREQISWAAKEAMKTFKVSLIERPTPVKVLANFYFVRPKKGQEWKSTKPDIDKLERAIFDAMTGIVYRDDSQIAFVQAAKFWAKSDWVSVSVEAMK